MTLPERIDTTALLHTMVDQGVAYIPGQSFFAEQDVRCCLRLNFSNASEAHLIRGMTAMGQLFRETLAKV